MSSQPKASFRDREEAGRRLGVALRELRGQDVLVIGIPRGGVPVAAEIARALGAELDVLVARKVGAPGRPELALGAVTADGARFFNEALVSEIGLSAEELRSRAALAAAEAERRETALRGARPAAPVAGRIAILVDDGLATGATVRAALRSLRRRAPRRIVLAVPVGSRQACDALAKEVDQLVCLETPEPFLAVGLHYADFEQTSDEEVRRLLGG